MENSLISEAEKSESILSQLVGPGWKERWMYWSSRTTEQVSSLSLFENAIANWLDRLITSKRKLMYVEKINRL